MTQTDTRDRLFTGNLTLLMALEANGMHRRASALVDKIDAGLRHAPKPKAEAPDRVSLPATERGRSERDLARLDVINARLTRGYQDKRGKTAAEQREEDLRRREALEREISDREEERRRLLAQAEADVLAAGRGEEVSTDSSGVKRILDRDPLLSLLRAGALTLKQHDAGQAVRELYELRKADSASVAFDGMPAGAHDHERFIGTRFLRAKAAVPAGQLEVAILNGHFRSRTGSPFVLKCWPDLRAAGMEPHISLRVLRDVCCEGKTLTSLGRGRAYDRHKKALAWALDVADEVLDAPRNGMVKP